MHGQLSRHATFFALICTSAWHWHFPLLRLACSPSVQLWRQMYGPSSFFLNHVQFFFVFCLSLEMLPLGHRLPPICCLDASDLKGSAVPNRNMPSASLLGRRCGKSRCYEFAERCGEIVVKWTMTYHDIPWQWPSFCWNCELTVFGAGPDLRDVSNMRTSLQLWRGKKDFNGCLADILSARFSCFWDLGTCIPELSLVSYSHVLGISKWWPSLADSEVSPLSPDDAPRRCWGLHLEWNMDGIPELAGIDHSKIQFPEEDKERCCLNCKLCQLEDGATKCAAKNKRGGSGLNEIMGQSESGKETQRLAVKRQSVWGMWGRCWICNHRFHSRLAERSPTLSWGLEWTERGKSETPHLFAPWFSSVLNMTGGECHSPHSAKYSTSNTSGSWGFSAKCEATAGGIAVPNVVDGMKSFCFPQYDACLSKKEKGSVVQSFKPRWMVADLITCYLLLYLVLHLLHPLAGSAWFDSNLRKTWYSTIISEWSYKTCETCCCTLIIVQCKSIKTHKAWNFDWFCCRNLHVQGERPTSAAVWTHDSSLEVWGSSVLGWGRNKHPSNPRPSAEAAL